MESESPKPECRWCGNAHDVKELCRARRVNRRRFLMALGASAAAVATAPITKHIVFVNGAITAETFRLAKEKMALSASMPRNTILLMTFPMKVEYDRLLREDRRYVCPTIVGAIRDVEVPDVRDPHDGT